MEYGGDGTKAICFRNPFNGPFSGNCSVPLERIHPRQGCGVSASERLILHPAPFHLFMIIADETSAVR